MKNKEEIRKIIRKFVEDSEDAYNVFKPNPEAYFEYDRVYFGKDDVVGIGEDGIVVFDTGVFDANDGYSLFGISPKDMQELAKLASRISHLLRN